MLPTLRDGDWLIARRTRRIRPGQVVLAWMPPRDGMPSHGGHPRRPALLLVKRATRRADGGWWLESDFPEAPGAVDSSGFGPVPDELIVGRVLARYWPRFKSRFLFRSTDHTFPLRVHPRSAGAGSRHLGSREAERACLRGRRACGRKPARRGRLSDGAPRCEAREGALADRGPRGEGGFRTEACEGALATEAREAERGTSEASSDPATRGGPARFPRARPGSRILRTEAATAGGSGGLVCTPQLKQRALRVVLGGLPVHQLQHLLLGQLGAHRPEVDEQAPRGDDDDVPPERDVVGVDRR
jgi:hypothetical protein